MIQHKVLYSRLMGIRHGFVDFMKDYVNDKHTCYRFYTYL